MGGTRVRKIANSARQLYEGVLREGSVSIRVYYNEHKSIKGKKRKGNKWSEAMFFFPSFPSPSIRRNKTAV